MTLTESVAERICGAFAERSMEKTEVSSFRSRRAPGSFAWTDGAAARPSPYPRSEAEEAHRHSKTTRRMPVRIVSRPPWQNAHQHQLSYWLLKFPEGLFLRVIHSVTFRRLGSSSGPQSRQLSRGTANRGSRFAERKSNPSTMFSAAALVEGRRRRRKGIVETGGIGVPPYDKIPLQGGMKFVGAIRNPR